MDFQIISTTFFSLFLLAFAGIYYYLIKIEKKHNELIKKIEQQIQQQEELFKNLNNEIKLMHNELIKKIEQQIQQQEELFKHLNNEIKLINSSIKKLEDPINIEEILHGKQ